MSGAIHIGTSGWSYKHWRSLYYPQKLAASRWLPHYAHDFSTTEINGSFYRLPSAETIEHWKTQVPDSFIFCPKMSRYLTHMKKLREPEEPLERFFNLFDAMQGRMGPVLLQLPPMVHFNAGVAGHFFGLLSDRYREYEFVLEVRHPSWLEQESLALMSAHRVGLVISHSEKEFPYTEEQTSKTVYVRFHGPKELYASSYSDAMLKSYARKFKKWAGDGCTVWVFFNNDIFGYAIEDAKRLKRMLGQ